jgi:hypothetical protein
MVRNVATESKSLTVHEAEEGSTMHQIKYRIGRRGRHCWVGERHLTFAFGGMRSTGICRFLSSQEVHVTQ